MAFEGYKKQIEDAGSDSETNKELLNKLLKLSIDIFSDDPTVTKQKEAKTVKGKV